MQNGTFTQEERAYLLSLDAVEEVRARSIIYSKSFKEECMRRYRSGEKPGAIFASAGLPASLIGYKRIERAIYHWKKACCWDNAPIESFWGRLKEEIGITSNVSHTEIIRLIDDYIDYYNNERGQARLGWRTPKEYAEAFVV